MDFEKVYGRTNCKYCDTEFVRRSHNHSQCDECRDRRALEEQERLKAKEWTGTCGRPNCDNEFTTRIPHKKYCSQGCAMDAEQERRERAYSQSLEASVERVQDVVQKHEQFQQMRLIEFSDRIEDLLPIYAETMEYLEVYEEVQSIAYGYICDCVHVGHFPSVDRPSRGLSQVEILVNLATLTYAGHDEGNIAYLLRNIDHSEAKDYWRKVRAYQRDLLRGRKSTRNVVHRYIFGILRNRLEDWWEGKPAKHNESRVYSAMTTSGLSYEQIAEHALTCVDVDDFVDTLTGLNIFTRHLQDNKYG
jgi:hypothetical protein